MSDLRNLGFAEGLELIEQPTREVLRLECGSLGVAVELSGAEEARGHYAIVALVTPGAPDTEFKSTHWPTVMKRLQAIPKPADD